MGVTWTNEQQKVIDLRSRNILVSAAAGSGKTAVLVERIITMLTDERHPVDVDRLLVVTFTEAAAAEMKERIRCAIEKKLEECPDNEHLKTQATLIHNAQITTIHSFCLSVIRDHFHAIDIDPGFRIGEEGELRLLKHDVLEKVLEENYVQGSQRFLDFTAAYGGGRSDKRIEELILKIFDFSRSYPDPSEWLSMCVKAYEICGQEELEQSGYIKKMMENVRRCLEDGQSLLKQGISICEEADGPSAYETTLMNDRMVISDLLKAATYEEMYEAVSGVKWVRLASNRDKTVSEEKIEQVKAIRDEVKSVVKEIAGQYFFQSIEEMLKDIQMCLPAVAELSSLVQEFAARFEETKRAQNMIDFSDMEQYALKILAQKTEDGFVPSAIACEYQKQYKEIMIDEYQDSNLIQETILTSISTIHTGRYNVFMVGDVKQSIYRFRLSRPELFMEKFETYDTNDSQMQRIDLHKNFRSREEVLNSVNYIFRQIMTNQLGGITYDDQAALYPGADYVKGQGNETEVLLIDTDVEEYTDDGTDKITDREMEGRAIAGRIRDLLSNQMVIDRKSGEPRPAKYSDIVILTRSVKGFADVFTEILNREGIPTYAGTREGYFETQEIGVLLDYLRVLNNRHQDLPLAAVLTSSMCGLKEEELAAVRSEYKDMPFHRAVEAYRLEGSDESIRHKLCNCLECMERFREQVPYTPMHELLWRILDVTGYGDFVSAMPGGEQRRANLEMLVEKARVFESTSYKGLFHFIRYIEQLRKYDVDYGEASLEDEQSDTVRIMTIHKSKGLEFPIVFVAGMGKRFNMQDARSSVVLHARLGVGIDAIDIEKRTKSPSILKKVIQKEEVLDSLGEELRVLYVALTRAREKLIITGTIPNLEKKMPGYAMVSYQESLELTFGRLSKASTYWDWIIPALIRKTEAIPIVLRTLRIEDLTREEIEEETAERITKTMLKQWDTDRIYEQSMHDSIEQQFGYHYPYEDSRTKKLKFTVTELKKREYLEEEAGEIVYEEPDMVPLIPNFLKEEEELTGASRGTAYHRLMELLDFSRIYDDELLSSEIEKLKEQGKMDEDMAACIRRDDILSFLSSTSGKRMRESANRQMLWKEQPFVLGVDAREIYPDEQEGELILVQGIIDAYFAEEDGLVVLDYKTDKVRDGAQLSEKYHAQLDYYAKALEQLTGKRVKEKLIYSFTLKKEIALP